jgi:hypothetical protein
MLPRMQLDQPAALRIVTRPRVISTGQGDSLEELDVRQMTTGAVADVVDPLLPAGQTLYYLDRASAAPPVFPNIVAARGGGRWLIISGGGGGGISAAANVGAGPGEVFQNILAGVLNLRTIASPDGSVSVATVGSQVQLEVQAYTTVQDEGAPLPQRDVINFVGAGVTAADVAGVTTVTIPGGGSGTVGDFTGNKALAVGAPVAGDQATTLLTISNTPANNGPATQRGYVTVQVNGVSVRLGGTTVAPSDCYFSSAGPGVAKALDNIAAGDTLYWNASVAGYGLAPTDRIDFLYSIT